MQPFTQRTGRAVPVRHDDIDTDQIVPAEFCKRVTKTGYQDALFAGWRAEPDCILDQPEYLGASIFLAGRDFGIGSSREHAVWALKDGGFVAVVATGFGDIFRRNATNNGLLPVDQPWESVQELMDAVERTPSLEVTIDLETCELRFAQRVTTFQIDDRTRRRLLDGHDAIGATLTREEQISAYELQRRHWLPTIPS